MVVLKPINLATYEGGVKKHIEFINSIKGFATAAIFITNQICEMDEVSCRYLGTYTTNLLNYVCE